MGVSYDDMKTRIMGELKKVFRPELLNRIDEVIVFHKLSKDEIKQIVDQLMKRLREQMKVHEVSIELTDCGQGVDGREGLRPDHGRPAAAPRDPALHRGSAGRLRPGPQPGSRARPCWSTTWTATRRSSLQLIEPVDVPDAPPADLVPAEGPASDEATDEHDTTRSRPTE